MREELNAELLRILRAITILNETSFSFAGKLFAPLDPAILQLQTYPSQNPLVAQLGQQLYQHCYCRRFDGDLHEEASVVNPASAEDILIPELSRANTSREHWDAGWQTHKLLPSGQILAHKNGQMRAVWPGEFVSHEGPGMAPREGARVSLFAPRDSQTMQPGFYFVFGESITDQQDDYNLVRFYWHIREEGAPTLVHLLTSHFNRFQVPFRFKSLANRSFYKRSDAAVLYVNKRFYRLAIELLGEIHGALQEQLGAETPLFSKRLAHGLGLAEEPGNGESFGQHRCRMVAEGLWKAYERGLSTDEERLREVAEQFARNRLTLDYPYLNPGSKDTYTFPARQAEH